MRHVLTTLAALTLAATAAGAQTPTPTPAPASPGMPQDSMRGMARDSMGTMRPGGMGPAGARRGAPDTALVAQLDSVNTAAKAGLTSLPASVAGPLLESLQNKLQATGRVPLQSIATDLGALRTELAGSTVNGGRVGAILRRVGPKVTAVAASQSGAVRTMLREIGRELTAAGRQLASGA